MTSDPLNRVTPDSAHIGFVKEAYERGLSLEAFRRAQHLAPLRHWTGIEPCIIAARIAANTGAPGLCTRLTLRAWKLDRRNAAARNQYGYEIFSRRGPLALWQVVRGWEDHPGDNSEDRAELFALKGYAASCLRDFALAESLIERALAIEPAKPWVRLQRANFLEHQDRVEEALEEARAACGLHPHPFYRPGVQTCAHLLQLLNRDEEAIELLHGCNRGIENGPVAAQLFSLLGEHDRWTEAEAALERYAELTPLAETRLKNWITAQRARVCYHLGKRSDSARYARMLEDSFHKRFAERVQEPQPERERMQLEVTFVRQHFKTCAPATLSALGRYWGMPTEHVKLAEAMCYDGTPHWQQREWAEKNGWHVREFRVTEETATALIERSMPFAVSAVDAVSAHMMAVIGFDRTRGTLLLRDPGQPYVVEVDANEFLIRNAAFGPHGMLFVPECERERVAGIELPDAHFEDLVHQFSVALTRHDRTGATEALTRLEMANGPDRLILHLRLDLAAYDANSAEQARWLDELIKAFPGTPALILRRSACGVEETQQDRIAFLEAACAEKNADSALLIALARSLSGDARWHSRVRLALKKAMRYRPMDSTAVCVLADLLWNENRTEEATELYRFAANIEGFREDFYRTWFLACRRTRHTEEALKHLQDRFERFGGRSEQPALTLAWALYEMEQPARARTVLMEAMKLRPKDGYLQLRGANLAARLGQNKEADELLAAARGNVRENDWLRAAAENAELRFDYVTAMEHSRLLLSRDPLALDAHERVARALARREGAALARAHLESAFAQFPHHYGLARMCVEWSRAAGPEAHEASARKLLALESADAWGHRELAITLGQLNRIEEALRAAEEAVRIEPHNTYSCSILGEVHNQAGNPAAARKHYREAIVRSVDNTGAIEALLRCATTDLERRSEINFVERELVRQVVTGDGLLTYVDLARPILDADALLDRLRKAHLCRPDLWHAWAALVAQLSHIGKLDEALQVAKQATERFPHLPRVWIDLANVHGWRGEMTEEIAAAQRAFEMNPAWPLSCVKLASALERTGDLEKASTIYDRALLHEGRDAQLHAHHANLLWRLQQPEAALAAAERALHLAPAFVWAWELVVDWASKCGQPERTTQLARALTKERPGEPGVWLTFARVLSGPEYFEERLHAANTAISLDERSAEAWDMKAELLTRAERFEEAIECCCKGIAVCGSDVHMLQGRRAWIEATRNRRSEAVALMRAVLAENSSYVWGWHQLALWLMQEGAIADAASALSALEKLRPHDAWVYRQLGFIRARQERLDDARKAFATALQFAPTDVVAAHNLFDLQLQADEPSEAEKTVEIMRLHQPGTATEAADVMLNLRRNDRTRAANLFKAICVSPDPDAWPIDACAIAFSKAGWRGEALKVLKGALREPRCSDQVAAAAIRLLLEENAFWAACRVFTKLSKGEARDRAVVSLAHGLARCRAEKVLRWMLWRHGAAFAGNSEAWATAGFALIEAKRMKQAAKWLGTWRHHADASPSALFNLCLALRHLGRHEEATAVAEHVVRTWNHREGASDVRVFLAIEYALNGRPEKAIEELDQFAPRDNVAYDIQMVALTKAVIQLLQTPRTGRSSLLATIRRDLGEVFKRFPLSASTNDVRRTFRRTARLFRREGAGAKLAFWFAWTGDPAWVVLALVPPIVAVVWFIFRVGS